MQHILDRPVVFVDIETTGSVENGRITEVGFIRVEKNEVVDEFVQLLNPNQFIPYHIQDLTGIVNEMVADKPEFSDITDRITEITDNAVFAAHNVWFDFTFIQQSMQRSGLQYCRDLLCTVKLSRELFPQQSSHSLDAVINQHDITCNERHRAYADAQAIKIFLAELQQQFTAGRLNDACESVLVEA